MFTQVRHIKILEDSIGQRIDNFFIRLCKGIPKNRIYKAIRSGEVRVNSNRVNAFYRLFKGDIIRVPPFKFSEKDTHKKIRAKEFPIIYEDDHLLVINKPAGFAVHGGSGISFGGVIEQLRAAKPEFNFLELVHRLDRDTSGLLMIAKNRKTLCSLHQMLSIGKINKYYLALVEGDWVNNFQHIKFSLTKKLLPSGERRVYIDPDNGKSAHTVVMLKNRFGSHSLLNVQLHSGRTHQIRVHLSSSGFPILGDEKYGHRNCQKMELFSKEKLQRMFLHAHRLIFQHPILKERLDLIAELPIDYINIIKN
ncbi:MAG: RluA family pseudouridine synthase [Bordetella sp.]|nr:MAG: RluA family pseudouridine synthase [Bordetella sp.]